LADPFNFTLRYNDEVLSLNNLKFGDYDDCIYPIVLEITDTTDKARSTSYLDYLEIDNEGWIIISEREIKRIGLAFLPF
jgi:hypothetical protein